MHLHCDQRRCRAPRDTSDPCRRAAWPDRPKARPRWARDCVAGQWRSRGGPAGRDPAPALQERGHRPALRSNCAAHMRRRIAAMRTSGSRSLTAALTDSVDLAALDLREQAEGARAHRRGFSDFHRVVSAASAFAPIVVQVVQATILRGAVRRAKRLSTQPPRC